MKRIINRSILYFILTILTAFFYFGFIKIYNYTGRTTLASVYPHVLFLGTVFYLVVMNILKKRPILSESKFNLFLKYYDTSIIGMILIMMVRGITQIVSPLPMMMSITLTIFTVIAHIGAITGLVYLYNSIKKNNI